MILPLHHYAVFKVHHVPVSLEAISEPNSELAPNATVSGGDDRARTGGLLRAKQVLSQLSYIPWWAHLDLNQGPRPYQGRALTN